MLASQPLPAEIMRRTQRCHKRRHNGPLPEAAIAWPNKPQW
jgi:hypothetical protein